MPTAEEVEAVELILGQYCVAFGQGAGHMRVSRATISELRKRYRRRLEAIHPDWEDFAVGVLTYIEAIGRIAAAKATAQALTTIGPKHFKEAAVAVQKEAKKQHIRNGTIEFFGTACD